MERDQIHDKPRFGITSTIEKLSGALGVAASYAVMVLIGFLTANVIMRYVFRKPFWFTEEVTGYLLIFIIFIGMAYTMKAGAHVVTDVFVRHIPPNVREALKIPRNILGLIFAVFFTISALILMIKNYMRGTIVFGSLGVPDWIPNIIFFIGGIFFLFEMIAILSRSVRRHLE
jgi:TRAP-type C4-dicarboxylate transport system permease small subunit